MAPSPKQALQNAFSKDSFLDDDPDDDWNASAAVAVARKNRHEDNEGLVPDDLHRVTSRVVQSNADGSAETVLATAAPSLSRTKSTVTSPNNNNLSNSLPMTRTKSTPHTINPVSPNVRLAYAMRKVFSREEKSEWRHQEVEELVDHHHNVQDNAPSPSSRVARVSSHIQGSWAEDGAELVLDDDEFDTIGINNRITADANLATAKTANSAFMEKAKRDKKSSAYKLRRFLSTPNSKSQKVSALRRTPSYEPEGYDEYGDAEYDEDEYERESPLYSNDPHLSSPVGLTRTLSLRRNKSSSNEKKLNGESSAEDDDLSTVAESIDSSSLDQYGRDGKKKKKIILKRIAIATFLLALGVTGVAVYMVWGNRPLEGNDSANIHLGDFDALGKSNNVQLAIAATSTTSEDEDDDDVMVEIRTDDEEMSWDSEDGTGKGEE